MGLSGDFSKVDKELSSLRSLIKDFVKGSDMVSIDGWKVTRGAEGLDWFMENNGARIAECTGGIVQSVHSFRLDELNKNGMENKLLFSTICEEFNSGGAKLFSPETVTAEDFVEMSKNYTDKDNCLEIFKDYRDEVGISDATDILESKHPLETYDEKLFRWYADYEFYLYDELYKNTLKSFKSEHEDYDFDFSTKQEEEFKEALRDSVGCKYPDFTDQEFETNIYMDGTFYPEDILKNKDNPVIWLADTQGYSRQDVKKAIEKGECGDSRFLKSLREEVLNAYDVPGNQLCFLVKAELGTLMNAVETMNDPLKDGVLKISMGTNFGIADKYDGGGSLMSVELEKPVSIKFSEIDSMMPDGYFKSYDIGNVYGMNRSVWNEGSIECESSDVEVTMKNFLPLLKKHLDRKEIYDLKSKGSPIEKWKANWSIGNLVRNMSEETKKKFQKSLDRFGVKSEKDFHAFVNNVVRYDIELGKIKTGRKRKNQKVER